MPRRRLRQLRTWERAGTTRWWRPHAPARRRLRKLRPRLSPGARPPPAAAPEPRCASGVTAVERGRAAQGGKRNARKLRNFRIWERLPDASASRPLRLRAPVAGAPQPQRLSSGVDYATPPQVEDEEASGLRLGKRSSASLRPATLTSCVTLTKLENHSDCQFYGRETRTIPI